MAYFRIQLYVNALRRQASFEMLIPNDMHVEAPVGEAIQPAKQLKTLFLLHGYTGCAGNWVPEELAARYGFAIVMPSVENSFYLDGISTGHQFQTFVGEELVDYVRRTFGLARSPADTYIMGMSIDVYKRQAWSLERLIAAWSVIRGA